MPNLKRTKGERNPKISGRTALTYYRSGPPSDKSPFQRRPSQKRRGLFTRALDWLVVLSVLAGVVYCLLLKPSPEVVLSSTAYRSAETYEEAATKSLKNLKDSNKLTFDEKGLEAELKNQFPEVSSVKADLPLFGQNPKLRIGISEPSLTLKGGEGTYGAIARLTVDSKGTVVGPSLDFPSTKDLPLITDETGFTARVGQSVLSPSDIAFVLTVIAQAKQAKVSIASLTLPKFAQELDLRTSDRDYYVKFYLGGDALTQSGQFLAARKNFDKTKKQPGRYLDVRVSGKVFYK